MSVINPEHSPKWRPRTVLTHSGLQRSQFEETSEAIFMTSGFVYQSAEEAEEAFKRSGRALCLFALRQSDDLDVRRPAAPP